MTIAANIRQVKERIARAAEQAGRDPAAIKLVAVIKNVPDELVWQALEAGITEVGENRVQAAAARAAALKQRYPQVTFHLIGHLQRNKVRQALDTFAIIESVDSTRLAAELNRWAAKPIPILIEVNTSGETTKFGIEPEQTSALVRFVSSLDKLQLRGLMTIGPLTGGVEGARRSFRQLRELGEQFKLPWLSMGMSDDFEVAVAEGANLVRLGRAIFKGG